MVQSRVLLLAALQHKSLLLNPCAELGTSQGLALGLVLAWQRVQSLAMVVLVPVLGINASGDSMPVIM